MHPTSLPGPYGSGDLGPEALAFVQFLCQARQSVWQVLPLNPSGPGNSPYQCRSSLAGNPLLISLERLAEQQWLTREEVALAQVPAGDAVDFLTSSRARGALLRKAARRFAAALRKDGEQRADFEGFCAEHAAWLDDHALFMAAREAHSGKPWTQWEPELARRAPASLERWRTRLASEIAAQKFWQWEFFRQWRTLRVACHRAGIRVLGDVPFYVAHDSADAWAAPHYFSLDEASQPLKVGGLPPDEEHRNGVLWGAPAYRWERMREDGFAWWKARLRGALGLFDMLRLEHFAGYLSCYEIPAGSRTAVHGSWMKAPGRELFEELTKELGALPAVAENLSLRRPEAEELRARFGFPGMAVLEFAFRSDGEGMSFRPHRYEHHLVASTSTHNSDTVMGWWTENTGESAREVEERRRERERASLYLNQRGERIPWAMIRALMASVADTVVFPMQDLLGLGSAARMNLPGRKEGNWRWRCLAGQLEPVLMQRLRSLSELYER